MTSGLTRFGGPRTVVCNLGTSGTLAAHTAGAAYSGTFNVTNRVGTVTAELVSATPALPAGWSLAVNQGTGVVTLAWPAAAPVSAPPLPNLDFEAGAANWLLGNAWIIDGAGLQDGGTQAGRYRGAGQSSLRHAQAVPVTPGTTITASARISKGANRKDFAGGAVVLEWLTAAGAPLSFSVGNVVNTGTAAFQTSTVTATAPAGAGLVRLAVSATRDIKGRASDSVYADNVTWNHTYTLPGGVNTDYAAVIRVRDGRGCQATFSQTVVAVTGTWMFFGNVNSPTGHFFATTTDPLNLNLAGRAGYGVSSAAITASANAGTILVPLIDGTSIMRSTNLGGIWSQRTAASAFGNDITPPARSGSRWVLGRSNTTVQGSADDGVTWANSTGQTARYLAAGAGNVVVGFQVPEQCRVSTDNGASFALGGTATGLGSPSGIAFSNSTFAVVGWSSSISRVSLSTNNGTSWSTPVALPFPTQSTATFVPGESILAGGTGVFLAVATNGEVVYTTDTGATWNVGGSTGMTVISSAAFGNGLFVITGSNGGVTRVAVSSDNGATWTQSTITNGPGTSYTFPAVVFIPA